jgi:flagellar protein FlaG
MQINSVSALSGVTPVANELNRSNTAPDNSQAAAQVQTLRSQAVTQAAQNQPSAKTDREPSREERRDAVQKLNEIIKQTNDSLQFSIDEDTDIRLVKLIDLNTKETVRQYPSEEIINIARAIDKLQGMLVRDKA